MQTFKKSDFIINKPFSFGNNICVISEMNDNINGKQIVLNFVDNYTSTKLLTNKEFNYSDFNLHQSLFEITYLDTLGKFNNFPIKNTFKGMVDMIIFIKQFESYCNNWYIIVTEGNIKYIADFLHQVLSKIESNYIKPNFVVLYRNGFYQIININKNADFRNWDDFKNLSEISIQDLKNFRTYYENNIGAHSEFFVDNTNQKIVKIEKQNIVIDEKLYNPNNNTNFQNAIEEVANKEIEDNYNENFENILSIDNEILENQNKFPSFKKYEEFNTVTENEPENYGKKEIFTKDLIYFEIDCEPYPYVICCFIGDKNKMFEKLSKITKKKEYKYIRKNFEFYDGCFIMTPSKLPIIYLEHLPKNILDLSILNHELFHCVFTLMKEIGAKLSLDSEENWAYFYESLSRKFMEKINLKINCEVDLKDDLENMDFCVGEKII